ncbi:hypothetical protein P152DRAFT_498643 [Eremomyces bilateralis CBS 781.70]|uniref:DUF8004 domain-containing protein n=1 Tax=Eremomyces bilateralis CBS 781.70 TaxID=1392243 RepID=A0A6G1GA05_9PEZI|nr:uncharacterized protein P152DRAFT_498643 [Eremomyces bilateralis CBS 781.70]KAF1814905.1 hypothetical protein P152DRAFT_498643 [Eremomyces bilateralis CBS 781.70]
MAVGDDRLEPPNIRVPGRTSSKSWNNANRFSWFPSLETTMSSQKPGKATRRDSYCGGSMPSGTKLFAVPMSLSAPTTRAPSPTRKQLLDMMDPQLRESIERGPNSRRMNRSVYMGISRRKPLLTGALNPTKKDEVRRWDGISKTACSWDGLRKDSELWFPKGNCLIYLYAKGHSRRGPSFCIPLRALQDSQCDSLLTICPAQLVKDATAMNPLREREIYEIYIPAPEDSMRTDALLWHITTRNFFAFLFGRPLVGIRLGNTAAALYERVKLYRTGHPNNQVDFLEYLEGLGYFDFVNCPDHALAALFFAERHQISHLYIEAFAHCVGMNENLDISPEFHPISHVTKALVTRAYLEMDVHLTRIQSALRTFLEDELSSTYLGLSNGARAHLDRFRSFLYQFYVEKFGYWPPVENTSFPKALYRSIYFDFANLHDYLVDLDSTNDLIIDKPANGGICVLQNVRAFDKRHHHTTLRHPLPLLPELNDAPVRSQSQRALQSLRIGTKQARNTRVRAVQAALRKATNCGDASVTEAPLVRAYASFESDCELGTDEKVSVVDARKVRWIVVYAVLQMLVSVIGAPDAVRNTEDSAYPLCCPLAGVPPWEDEKNPSLVMADELRNGTGSQPPTPEVLFQEEPPRSASPTLSIHPDCETDYFNFRNQSNGVIQDVEIPAPLRINTNVDSGKSRPSSATSARDILRSSSIRSIKALSPFSSRRGSVVAAKPTHPAFCEIIVHGYGNGLNPAIVSEPSGSAPDLAPLNDPASAPAADIQISGPTMDAETSQEGTDHPEVQGAKSVRRKASPLHLHPHSSSTREDGLPLLVKPRTPTFGTQDLESFLITESMAVIELAPATPSGSSIGTVDTPVWSSGGVSRSDSAGSVESMERPGTVSGGEGWRDRGNNRVQWSDGIRAKHVPIIIRRSVSLGGQPRVRHPRSIDIFDALKASAEARG